MDSHQATSIIPDGSARTNPNPLSFSLLLEKRVFLIERYPPLAVESDVLLWYNWATALEWKDAAQPFVGEHDVLDQYR
jgi:hypothetical protein